MKIDDWRQKIDDLNGTLIDLLNKRALYAVEIGKIKKEENLPIFDAGREQIVLEKVRALAQDKGPLPPESIAKIFQVIIEETRKTEE